MEVLSFAAQPESRGRNMPPEFVVDSGGSTKGFDNFNLSIDSSKLNEQGKRAVLVKRGEAEFHSAWTIHRSDPNMSDSRRMAWIVRYCPTGTRICAGVRGSFDEQYPLVPVLGRGSDHAGQMDGLFSLREGGLDGLKANDDHLSLIRQDCVRQFFILPEVFSMFFLSVSMGDSRGRRDIRWCTFHFFLKSRRASRKPQSCQKAAPFPGILLLPRKRRGRAEKMKLKEGSCTSAAYL
eukprot:NODE_2396_length_1430_cov_90.110176_g2279_i0.p1 GENE.NODE_2396_length_1430_cov_90.110176_g2279_i0~~NODE_2396_length_1430_cov_90.110176_g2279_i0.p1  ORF type:complete len:236 (-),score=11.43 NODE_2396_length_1430_cov_90.110176_g2279_i0:51-758(-)